MYQGKFLAENRAAKTEQPKKTAAVPSADEILDEELAVQGLIDLVDSGFSENAR